MKLHYPPVIATIFDWLDEVRARPGMYFTELSQLELLIHGYGAALAAHGLDEDAPSMSYFAPWLETTHGWGKCSRLGARHRPQHEKR